MKLYLIGLPGSGKSFLGKQLAGELKLPFIDLDGVIERETGMAISEIFSEKGEAHFRNLEAEALRQQSKTPAFVMACGGGTPCFHDNMKFIKVTGKSIFLDVPVAEIVKRLHAPENQNRPLLTHAGNGLAEKLTRLLEQRKSFYEQAAVVIKKTTLEEIKRVLKK